VTTYLFTKENYVHDSYEIILDYMPNIFYWTNKESILLGGNSNFLKFLSVGSKKEILKLPHREMLKLTNWTETQSKIIEQTEILVMTTGIAELNIHLPPFSVNGEKQYFLLNKVPVINFEQEITGVISTLINITEFKKEVYFLKYILNSSRSDPHP